MNYLLASAQAVAGHDIACEGARVLVPGSLTIRLSTVLGNRRIHRLMQPWLVPGAVIVDAGANIGFNTVFAARQVGPGGRVIAVEPAEDNLRVLRSNVRGLPNVEVRPVAAGRTSEVREFYLRGDISAVNSFYQDSVYSTVTGVVRVPVEPIDAMVPDGADLVKIDVEGAELDVLAGMPRLLASGRTRLIVEWHPLLQEKAGFDAEALPAFLLERGFSLTSASHLSTTRLERAGIARVVAALRQSGRPVDLLAVR